MEFTKDSAIAIINSRKMIAREGYYEVKVTNEPTPYDGKFICNLSAMTNFHLEEAKKLATEGKFQEATNQQLSASLRPTDYIPSKGEIVKVYVAEVTTKNGVTGLFVTSLTELKATKAGKVSFSFDDIEIPATSAEAFTEPAIKAKGDKVTA